MSSRTDSIGTQFVGAVRNLHTEHHFVNRPMGGKPPLSQQQLNEVLGLLPALTDAGPRAALAAAGELEPFPRRALMAVFSVLIPIIIFSAVLGTAGVNMERDCADAKGTSNEILMMFHSADCFCIALVSTFIQLSFISFLLLFLITIPVYILPEVRLMGWYHIAMSFMYPLPLSYTTYTKIQDITRSTTQPT